MDAYEDILIEHGPASVTLEAVAARAGVSKGGLLYHFGSKEELLVGLIERVLALGRADIETARTAPEGAVRYYLHTSVTDVTENSPVHRTTMAAMRLIGNERRVDIAMRSYTQNWRILLKEHIEDPVTAELVGVIGEGLYMRALIGEDPSPLLDEMPAVLSRLGV
jgi:AcrR family transcriptional regulator